jgi:hypothetical protein
MTMKRNSVAAAVGAIVLFSTFAFGQSTHAAAVGAAGDPGAPATQGCVNQGNDRREFAPIVCWMQRHMSWKSEHEPYFAVVGKPESTHLGLAWPPYLVLNSLSGNGEWRVFRIGFRYDRTWRGYIFPTMAAKRLSHPLRY